MGEPNSATWAMVCEGELGDCIDWKSGFESLRDVAEVTAWLENVDRRKIDWSLLIGDHTYFAKLPEMSFPPLYSVEQFEEAFDDFLCLVDEPITEQPMSFNRVRLYIAVAKQSEVVETFRRFREHLVSLPLIKASGCF